MASTDLAPPASLGPGDAPDGFGLSAAVGWNQTVADWRFMLEHGAGFGVRSGAGELVASAIALPLDDDIAWIAMVLVAPAWRRRGLAGRLVGATLAWCAEHGRHAGLDATPAGVAVYRQMGFRPVTRLTRWRRKAGGTEPTILPGDAQPVDRAALGRLDMKLGLLARGPVLDHLLAAAPALARLAGEDGFVLGRPGRTAVHAGPLAAVNETVATDLLDGALGRIEGPVVLDAFDERRGFASRLAARDFVPERPFLRMVHVAEADGAALAGLTDRLSPRHLYLAAGPELA